MIRSLLLLLALIATADALIASSADMPGDTVFWLLVAVLSLSLFVAARHEHQRRRAAREASRRLAMAAYRHDVWARRDEWAGLR